MAFKDVLLSLTTYPDPTPVSALEDPIAFAAAIGARISAVACEVKYRVPGSVFGNMLLNIPAIATTEFKKSAANAEELLSAFQSAAERKGVFGERITEQCLTSDTADVLIEHARLRDLTIVPVPDGDHLDQWYAQSIIFGSGRPTLVTPHARKRTGALTLNTVAVAWDFSRPAARAVADALPILEKAKQVHIVTVTHEKNISSRRSADELAKNLLSHDVQITLNTVDAGGRGIGETLTSYVDKVNADILIMGAYGHSRLRDFILGGATKSMVSKPPVPIFLSH
ncbi:universal stress protein [Afipia carboxidovorans]|uniref:universal stress protein n=1 Tax=Afipia carboxidovorans TaxID=40137 RepID=UPI003089268C|nr:universal stress protein [Afipia carboxidovorans]